MFLQEVMQHLEDRLEKVQCNWDFGQWLRTILASSWVLWLLKTFEGSKGGKAARGQQIYEKFDCLF